VYLRINSVYPIICPGSAQGKTGKVQGKAAADFVSAAASGMQLRRIAYGAGNGEGACARSGGPDAGAHVLGIAGGRNGYLVCARGKQARGGIVAVIFGAGPGRAVEANAADIYNRFKHIRNDYIFILRYCCAAAVLDDDGAAKGFASGDDRGAQCLADAQQRAVCGAEAGGGLHGCGQGTSAQARGIDDAARSPDGRILIGACGIQNQHIAACRNRYAGNNHGRAGANIRRMQQFAVLIDAQRAGNIGQRRQRAAAMAVSPQIIMQGEAAAGLCGAVDDADGIGDCIAGGVAVADCTLDDGQGILITALRSIGIHNYIIIGKHCLVTERMHGFIPPYKKRKPMASAFMLCMRRAGGSLFQAGRIIISLCRLHRYRERFHHGIRLWFLYSCFHRIRGRKYRLRIRRRFP